MAFDSGGYAGDTDTGRGLELEVGDRLVLQGVQPLQKRSCNAQLNYADKRVPVISLLLFKFLCSNSFEYLRSVDTPP